MSLYLLSTYYLLVFSVCCTVAHIYTDAVYLSSMFKKRFKGRWAENAFLCSYVIYKCFFVNNFLIVYLKETKKVQHA